ncbi:MAG: HsdR family type I site-specific deoxyribonuclease [Thermoflexibacter sp.]|nr:HsdR family type I site-specific deoxyribonuclease [Thermoflexibacter sp.]
MAFINEDDIEKATIQIFTQELGYQHLHCLTVDALDRQNPMEVFDKKRLLASLQKINPALPLSTLQEAVEVIIAPRLSTLSLYAANAEFYHLLRYGWETKVRTAEGREEKKKVHFIDFQYPHRNDFVVVSQLWIESAVGQPRRPDLLVYINGMSLIFIELKRSDKPLQNAYNDNLVRYRDVIRQLFVPNIACVLSNGAESKIGAYNAGFKFFKDWFRKEEDKDSKESKLNKRQIAASNTSLDYLARSFCEKNTLIDFIENFVLYEKDKQIKILAQNHQFLGVNNALQAYEKADKNKIGTFWHTQGSGKSYSMIFFTEKLRRKYQGDFTFLIITDREDLDRQIYENYVKAGVIKNDKNAEKVSPRSSKELREFLQGNKRYIFTLIHKFRPEKKGEPYPLLSTRSDIIVIVDEAHRTQYSDLADNMRIGLPNAKYLAFTGTPLIQSGITAKYFGEIISEYNFAQSIEDGATVPLYYNRRVPQVQIVNETLQEEYEEIIESEDLSEEQILQLESKFAKEYEIIKRDDRLETIAKDIVKHFPYRGYLGKGMVISIDKFTAVRMYDKVSYHWKEEIKTLQKQALKAKTKQEKDDLQKTIDFLRNTEMAVVISGEDGEEEKFAKQNLQIKVHRDRMNEKDAQEHDITHNFKDDEHPLRLVFVCAMWLTGFDSPTVSTLYLDKPMQNQSLMQAIARANRVSSHIINGISKINGEVVDYYGVFRKLKKALAVYAEGTQTSGVQVEKICQPSDYLKVLLQAAIDTLATFCQENLQMDLFSVLLESDTNERIKLLEIFANKILVNDETKKTFIVYQNTISDLYAACRPEIAQEIAYKQKVDMLASLRGIVDRKRQIGDLDDAENRLANLLDESVLTAQEPQEEYGIKGAWTIDLSKLDYEKLREQYKQTPLKNIAIADIRAFVEQKLQKLLDANPTRTPFIERYENLIQGYNEGKFSTEALIDEFSAFVQSLEAEEMRHIREGLTEEELVLFDLLDKPKLSNEEKQKVKDAAKELLARIKDEKEKILVVDWEKTHQTRLQVQNAIDKILNDYLPEKYDRLAFRETSNNVFNHLLAHQARYFYK